MGWLGAIVRVRPVGSSQAAEDEGNEHIDFRGIVVPGVDAVELAQLKEIHDRCEHGCYQDRGGAWREHSFLLPPRYPGSHEVRYRAVRQRGLRGALGSGHN